MSSRCEDTQTRQGDHSLLSTFGTIAGVSENSDADEVSPGEGVGFYVLFRKFPIELKARHGHRTHNVGPIRRGMLAW